jgi:tetratricopeptide (TPR) repeat protein
MKASGFSVVLMLVSMAGLGQFKFYEQGIDAYQAKDYPGAIKNLNEYLDYTTRDKSFDVEVHYYLALSYFKTQSYTSAVREFDEALQRGHKNEGNIHWFMAKGYHELKVYKESIEEYTKALALIKDKPNQAKLLLERSEQYLKLGDVSRMNDDLTQASGLDKSNQDIKNAIAVAQGKKEDPTSRTLLAKDESKDRDEKGETNKKEDQPVVNLQSEAKIVEPTLADLYKDEKRYALVIGNATYQHVAPLKNSANDANDIAVELERSNFEVIKVINGSYNEMREAYRRFQEKLASGPKDQTIGLFYYAGHGLQNEGENYLVPVEANIQYEDDIPRACFAVQRVVVANMERSNTRMNIIILDACRNNPFPSAYRSSTGGLAEIKRAKGSFIAYATAPGSIASDGEGRNGLYTQELLKAMRKPGRTIEQVFKDVRFNVMTLSGEKQYTWDQSNIIGDFYFRF